MEGVQAGTENSPRTESGNSEFQAIPIRLRGQIIGAVNLSVSQQHSFKGNYRDR